MIPQGIVMLEGIYVPYVQFDVVLLFAESFQKFDTLFVTNNLK